MSPRNPLARRSGTTNTVIVSGAGGVGIGGDNYGSITTWTLNSISKITWPRRVGSVPRLADAFQTRAAAHEVVTALGGMGQTAAPAQLLSGLGGVGKTQLAVNLAESAWTVGELDLLVWIPASSRQAIVACYAQAAVDIALVGAGGRDCEQDAHRFLAWLAGTERRWMVVLDDLRNPADLNRLWPPNSVTGRTVVTTRLRGSALDSTDHHLVQIEEFSPNEAMAYLSARLAEYPGLADDTNQVAADLGYLPLALSQATAFIIDEVVPCSEYVQRFADRRQNLDNLVPEPDELPDDYAYTVAATLSLSLEAADRGRPAGFATLLLQVASMLSPAGIPVSVFTTSASRNWFESTSSAQRVFRGGRSRKAGIDTVRSGLQRLHRLNLATVDSAAVTVHRLVQRFVRDKLSDDQIEGLVRVDADALLEAWPDFERTPLEGQVMRENSTALLSHPSVIDILCRQGLHQVILRNGRSIGESGQAAVAVDYFRRILDIARSNLGSDQLDTLTVRLLSARWQGRSGDPDSAVAQLSEVVSDSRRVLGNDHPATLAARANLAYWKGASGDCSTAYEAFRDLASDTERICGRHHPDTLAARHGMAWSAGKTGDFSGAVEGFRDLLPDMERILGPSHPDALATRHGMAWYLGKAGDPAAAAGVLRDVVTDSGRALGEDHPVTVIARGNWAYWQGQAGDPAAAVGMLRDVVTDSRRALGEDHPVTIIVDRLADLHMGPIRRTDTTKVIEELLGMQVPVLGPAHPSAASDHRLALMRPHERENYLVGILETLDIVGRDFELDRALRWALVVLDEDGAFSHDLACRFLPLWVAQDDAFAAAIFRDSLNRDQFVHWMPVQDVAEVLRAALHEDDPSVVTIFVFGYPHWRAVGRIAAPYVDMLLGGNSRTIAVVGLNRQMWRWGYLEEVVGWANDYPGEKGEHPKAILMSRRGGRWIEAPVSGVRAWLREEGRGRHDDGALWVVILHKR